MINTNEKELLDAIMKLKEIHGAMYVSSIQEIEEMMTTQRAEAETKPKRKLKVKDKKDSNDK